MTSEQRPGGPRGAHGADEARAPQQRAPERGADPQWEQHGWGAESQSGQGSWAPEAQPSAQHSAQPSAQPSAWADPEGQGVPGRWEPLPQGDYDDGATGFVRLPEGFLDAAFTRPGGQGGGPGVPGAASGDPLAAPGHGYVPPPIVPSGPGEAAPPVPPAAGTGPGAPGQWTMPFADSGATGGGWGTAGTGAVDPGQWTVPAAEELHDDSGDYVIDGGRAAPYGGQWYEGQPAPAPTGQWSFPSAPSVPSTGAGAGRQQPAQDGELPYEDGPAPGERDAPGGHDGWTTTAAATGHWTYAAQAPDDVDEPPVSWPDPSSPDGRPGLGYAPERHLPPHLGAEGGIPGGSDAGLHGGAGPDVRGGPEAGARGGLGHDAHPGPEPDVRGGPEAGAQGGEAGDRGAVPGATADGGTAWPTPSSGTPWQPSPAEGQPQGGRGATPGAHDTGSVPGRAAEDVINRLTRAASVAAERAQRAEQASAIRPESADGADRADERRAGQPEPADGPGRDEAYQGPGGAAAAQGSTPVRSRAVGGAGRPGGDIAPADAAHGGTAYAVSADADGQGLVSAHGGGVGDAGPAESEWGESAHAVPGGPPEAAEPGPDEAAYAGPDEAVYAGPDEAAHAGADATAYAGPGQAPHAGADEQAYAGPDEAPHAGVDGQAYAGPDQAAHAGAAEAPYPYPHDTTAEAVRGEDGPGAGHHADGRDAATAGRGAGVDADGAEPGDSAAAAGTAPGPMPDEAPASDAEASEGPGPSGPRSEEDPGADPGAGEVSGAGGERTGGARTAHRVADADGGAEGADGGEDPDDPAVAGEGVGGAGETTPSAHGEEPDADPVAAQALAEAATGADSDAAPHSEHPHASYVLTVNGADRPVTDAWIGESLLYVLRERLGLAGAKDGCSQGECGACSVRVDGRLVASCLVPAATSAGCEVRTVEGLAEDGVPSDVQRALAACGAVQCGFCVPGLAMTVHDLLAGNPAPTELETRQAICGNLCRCSGYRGVLEAVREVVAARAEHSEPEADPEAAEPRQPSAGPDPENAPRIPHQAAPYDGDAPPGGAA
ncbi:2Fe-2S iron-sulfur cluster-binding protein [Streptomyces pathocidini]